MRSMTAAESLSGMGSDLTASAIESYVAPGPECATTAPRALRKPAWSSLRSFLAHCEWKHSCACCCEKPGPVSLASLSTRRNLRSSMVRLAKAFWLFM